MICSMDIPISTPALLFPAIAILMLGYVNRYLGTASLIRSFKKDYDTGYSRVEIVQQLKILKKRIELSRHMISIAAAALMFACLSMFLIFAKMQDLGNASFGASLILMIVSVSFSLYETKLSNKSLIIEIHDIFEQETKKSR